MTTNNKRPDVLYNEYDSFASKWLQNLADFGMISSGEVDNRDFRELIKTPEIFKGRRRVHLCAGIGGWEEALRLAGWPVDRPVWTVSFPCQPFSSAGLGLGKEDERHLFPAFVDLLKSMPQEQLPSVVFGEQVASKAGREWLGGVRSEMEALGYSVGATDLCASSVGAPQIRQRLFWVARLDGRLPHATVAKFYQQSPTGNECGDAQDEKLSEDDGRGGRVSYSDGNEPRQITRYAGEVISIPLNEGKEDGASIFGGDGAERVAHTDARRLEQRIEEERGLPIPNADCDGGLGDTIGATTGTAHWSSDPKRRDGVENDGNLLRSDTPDDGDLGWSDSRFVKCADGKHRRIKPGLMPLAHGVQGRVGLIRGYGNAIVPQVAQIFIEAFMEAEMEL